VFILLEFRSPSRRIFIGSHSLPPSLVRRIGPSGSTPDGSWRRRTPGTATIARGGEERRWRQREISRGARRSGWKREYKAPATTNLQGVHQGTSAGEHGIRTERNGGRGRQWRWVGGAPTI
jgi:hypothetical protein